MDFKSKLFKNLFSFITISGLVFLSSIQVNADQGQRPIFREIPGSKQVNMAPVNPLIVKRQRSVAIQSEAIEKDIETLNLNLFDDTHIKVVKDRLRQNRKNQFTWKGHIDGVNQSEVVLVMNPRTKRMSGTVNTPDRCFHIRPDGRGEHVVQEIDPFLTEKPEDEQITENTGSENEENAEANLSEEEGELEQPLFFDQVEESDGETVIEDETSPNSENASPAKRQPFYRKSRNEYIAHFNRLMREHYRRYLIHHGTHYFGHHSHHGQHSHGQHQDMFDIPMPEQEAGNDAEMPVEAKPEGEIPVEEMAEADTDTIPEEDSSTIQEEPVEAEPAEQVPTDETIEINTDPTPEEDAQEEPVEVEQVPAEETTEVDTDNPTSEDDTSNPQEAPAEETAEQDFGTTPDEEVPVNAEPVDQIPAETEDVATTEDEEQNSTPSTPNASTFEQQVLALVNQERAIRNLHPLVMNAQLVQSARAHSADMAQQNFFSHTGLDGRSPGDRIEAAGYQGNAWGENIAFGQTTPEEVMNSWMNSPGHAANILHQDFCDIGVGYEPNGRYWTQNFGRKSGVSQCQ